MAETRVGDAIAAIVAVLRADPAVTDLASVVDGPIVSGADPETRIYIGYDGDNAGDYNATEEWSQGWVGLGAGHRSESFSVVCAVWSWSGDMDVSTRRARALAALAAVQAALRDPLNRGLGLPGPTLAQWSQGQLMQEPVIDEETGAVLGLRARIPFSISVTTRV
jgi:hypothetical protein